MKKFFKLEENNTTISKEVVAGLTTFFTMVYIIFVNPNLLSISGIPWSAVFLATIIATAVGTLVMGLFANVPYALAPGMGLNAFFTFTVVLVLGFTWQEALGLVFICGIINILITVTKVRKAIIRAIPKFLQNAIGGGIGLFIAYIGFLNVGGITGGLTGGLVPSLSTFNNLPFLLAMFGLVLTIVLMLLKVKGSILIGIVGTTLVGLVVTLINPATALVPLPEEFVFDIGKPFVELFTSNNSANEPVFLAAFRGIGGLFTSVPKFLTSLFAIFAFSLTDTFDTIGTFVGTGRKSGIFTDEDMLAMESGDGFKTKMEKALFADAIATSVGAIFGTSNTTTYIESAAGIEEGGRTGLTSVTTAALFILCIFLSPIIGLVPSAATAPALIVVGIMMVGSFAEINWKDLTEAIPAFFAALVMALAYNISTGIAFGFIFYIIVKLVKKQAKDIHPIVWGSTGLFVLYFILMALKAAGVI
ncbi:MAG: NCS2 family permease [Bacilli bacterium]|nr:NCS2 family permease [Bacilli bacterium]